MLPSPRGGAEDGVSATHMVMKLIQMCLQPYSLCLSPYSFVTSFLSNTGRSIVSLQFIFLIIVFSADATDKLSSCSCLPYVLMYF